MTKRPTIYVRQEPTDDGFVTEGTKFDITAYRDRECTQRIGTFPWHHRSKPAVGQKFITLNCARYEAVWLPALKGRWIDSAVRRLTRLRANESGHQFDEAYQNKIAGLAAQVELYDARHPSKRQPFHPSCCCHRAKKHGCVCHFSCECIVHGIKHVGSHD